MKPKRHLQKIQLHNKGWLDLTPAQQEKHIHSLEAHIKMLERDNGRLRRKIKRRNKKIKELEGELSK